MTKKKEKDKMRMKNPQFQPETRPELTVIYVKDCSL